jgi:hypothetical protein
MAKNCEITIKNGTPVVQTHPKLMQDILSYTDFNVDQSLDLYGIALSDEFQNLNIANPTLANILAFNEQDSIDTSKTLSKKDRQNLLDISLQNQYIGDIKNVLLDTLNVNGEFGIDMNKMKASGLFSDSDIIDVNKPENVDSLRQLYYKLNNTDEAFSGISSAFVLQNGLFSKVNPDEFLQHIYDNYIDSQSTEDVINRANELADETVTENTSLAPLIYEAVKNKQSLVQYETDEYNGGIVKKAVNNPRLRLEQSLDLDQDFTTFLDQLQYARELPIEMYAEEFPALSQYFFNLEEQAVDLGLDIKGISDIMGNKTYAEIQDFSDSLYNFILDAQDLNNTSIEETMDTYAEAHNTFFETEPLLKNTVTDRINSNGVYLHLETNRSEEDLFNSNSIIRKANNVYQKITDDNSLEDLYNYLYSNPALLPVGTLTVPVREVNRDLLIEDIDKYVSAQANNYLTETSDVDTLKKITAYKLLNNIKTSETEKVLNGLDNIDVNNFLNNFNKTMLKNPRIENLFYFSNRGLEAKQVINEYTAQQLKNELNESTFDNLVLYSKVSGNESLDYMTNFNNDISPENMRDYYANNLNQLPAFSGNYYFNNGYMVAESSDPFLKFKNNLYENVAPNVFAKVETNDRYTNFDLQKPSYDNSVTPELQGQEGKKIEITKMKNINDDVIEFC